VFEVSIVQQLIVQRFLAWASSVGSEERAKGVYDLTLAYLHGGLHETERQEIVTVLTALLDDPSPAVKRAMAEVLADREDVPRHIIVALAGELADISAQVLRRSPLLTPAELVDFVRMGAPSIHMAIAQRQRVPSIVAMALLEHAQADVVLALAGNEGADLSEGCLLKMLDLYGKDGQFRETVLARPHLPSVVRVELVSTTAQVLSSFVQQCEWMSEERSERMAQEASEHATLIISNEIPVEHNEAIVELVAHLRTTGRLTAGLMMRALLFGERRLFETALSVLSGQPLGRVASMVRAPYGSAFVAVYNKAGMPEGLMPAFQMALKGALDLNQSMTQIPSRKIIADVLGICEQLKTPELASLAYRLRRLDAEAARQEVRAMRRYNDDTHADVLHIDIQDMRDHDKRAA
jgi:uncharacterized protein (DUF2336 family)